MYYKMNKILNAMEDIKQNIKDNEYKIIMDSLMEIKKEQEKEKLEIRYRTQEEIIYIYTQRDFDDMAKIMVNPQRLDGDHHTPTHNTILKASEVGVVQSGQN